MKRTIIILIFVIVSILIGIFIMQTGRKKNNKTSPAMENPLTNKEMINFNFKKKLETDNSEPIKPITKNEAEQAPKLSKIIPKSSVTVKKSIPTISPKIVEKIEKDDGRLYYIQVASYQEIEKAYALKEKLQMDFIKVQIFKATIPNKGLWYRVKIGPVKSTLKKQYKKILNDKYHIEPLITEAKSSK